MLKNLYYLKWNTLKRGNIEGNQEYHLLTLKRFINLRSWADIISIERNKSRGNIFVDIILIERNNSELFLQKRIDYSLQIALGFLCPVEVFDLIVRSLLIFQYG